MRLCLQIIIAILRGTGARARICATPQALETGSLGKRRVQSAIFWNVNGCVLGWEKTMVVPGPDAWMTTLTKVQMVFAQSLPGVAVVFPWEMGCPLKPRVVLQTGVTKRWGLKAGKCCSVVGGDGWWFTGDDGAEKCRCGLLGLQTEICSQTFLSDPVLCSIGLNAIPGGPRHSRLSWWLSPLRGNGVNLYAGLE